MNEKKARKEANRIARKSLNWAGFSQSPFESGLGTERAKKKHPTLYWNHRAGLHSADCNRTYVPFVPLSSRVCLLPKGGSQKKSAGQIISGPFFGESFIPGYLRAMENARRKQQP